ncbi:hypothetical protein MA16_Dca024389 [Dendrobium catenatum]|uniref:Uncharacterized protein n=1 Tax=Dendrobium catenatum TaxID=906689 RepID=A0A2I0WVX7_9ASPA|nr:hypothetical protein MA16_Dca024389 [Dendrobium catenatum]
MYMNTIAVEAQPTLTFLFGTERKTEAKSLGTEKNPCGGGPAAINFLFVGRRFLGAGGQTNAGFNLLSSVFGVTAPSSSTAASAIATAFLFVSPLLVPIGASSGNSSTKTNNLNSIKEEEE